MILVFLLISCTSDKELLEQYEKAMDKHESGDYIGAVRGYTEIIEIDPEYEKVTYFRAIAKASLGDNVGALADYDKAIEIDPEFALAYRFRGVCKINLGDKEEGCLDLSKAGELGSDEAYETIKKNCD